MFGNERKYTTPGCGVVDAPSQLGLSLCYSMLCLKN